MQIKTKYNVGDTFYILSNEIKKCKVSSIEISVSREGLVEVEYAYNDGNLLPSWVREYEAFSSPEEVIDHLKKENNIRD